MTDLALSDTLYPALVEASGLALACRLALRSSDGESQTAAIGDALELLESHPRAATAVFQSWRDQRREGRR